MDVVKHLFVMIRSLLHRIDIGSDPLVCLVCLGAVAVEHGLDLLDA